MGWVVNATLPPGVTRYVLCRRLEGPSAGLEGAENPASTEI